MNPNYNKVAWFYDNLAMLVFGSALEDAKKCNLHKIGAQSKVLIIGGGTGSILNYLSDYNVTIDFVEISENMLRRAKERVGQNMEIQFYNADIFSFKKTGYDVVICNFFIDQLNNQNAKAIADLSYNKLNVNGLLLISDFIYRNQLKYRFLIRTMYLFFQITANLKKVILTDFKILFTSERFLFVSSTFVRGNIRADVYQKSH